MNVFSSAFNTIQPHSLVRKLLNTKLPLPLFHGSLITLHIDFMEYGWSTAEWSTVICHPSLFSLYTADCRSTDESCPLVKFADDTELVGNISNDEDALYHKRTENFVNWCDQNYLYFNVSKTKEMCVDFRKNQRCPKPVYIKGEAVERVDTYIST